MKDAKRLWFKPEIDPASNYKYLGTDSRHDSTLPAVFFDLIHGLDYSQKTGQSIDQQAILIANALSGLFDFREDGKFHKEIVFSEISSADIETVDNSGVHNYGKKTIKGELSLIGFQLGIRSTNDQYLKGFLQNGEEPFVTSGAVFPAHDEKDGWYLRFMSPNGQKFIIPAGKIENLKFSAFEPPRPY